MLVKHIEMNVAFGDYYLFNYLKSEYLFIAVTHVEAFAISRDFIHGVIYPRYPAIIDQMRDQAKYSYNSNIAYELGKHKAEHVAYMNKNHSYEGLSLQPKRQLQEIHEQTPLLAQRYSAEDQESFKIRIKFRDRLTRVDAEVRLLRETMRDQL